MTDDRILAACSEKWAKEFNLASASIGDTPHDHELAAEEVQEAMKQVSGEHDEATRLAAELNEVLVSDNFDPVKHQLHLGAKSLEQLHDALNELYKGHLHIAGMIGTYESVIINNFDQAVKEADQYEASGDHASLNELIENEQHFNQSSAKNFLDELANYTPQLKLSVYHALGENPVDRFGGELYQATDDEVGGNKNCVADDGKGDQDGTHKNPLGAGRFKPNVSNDPPDSFPRQPGESHADWWERYLQHWDGGALPTQEGVACDNDPRLKALAAGASKIGTDYVTGGGHLALGPTAPTQNNPLDVGKKGFDCSGFMRYLIEKGWGFDPGDISTYSMPGKPFLQNINQSELHAGDIILCEPERKDTHGNVVAYGHVVMYIGNHYYIDANQSSNAVAVSNDDWFYRYPRQGLRVTPH